MRLHNVVFGPRFLQSHSCFLREDIKRNLNARRFFCSDST